MKKWLLFLPVTLFVLQYILTVNSMGQIRYEELAESVRNVYWLENGTIYDGVSSNVGWYGTLLLIYKTFGFSLFTAKFFRLFLFLVSLFCTFLLLKKYLGPKKSLVPLIAFGLSPTLLFFNTVQTAIGLDLLYLPVCLYLVMTINFQKLRSSFGRQTLLWSIAMIAWMSYPTFVFYLPAIGALYVWQLYIQVGFKKPLITGLSLLTSLLVFLWPLLAALFYVKDKNLLIFDPVTKSGIFRGAGSFYLDFGAFYKNLGQTLSDIFIRPGSYYYEVFTGDFSNFYPVVPVITVLTLALILCVKFPKYRFPLVLSWFTLVFTLLVANLTSELNGYPGIRRNTAILSAFYTMFAVVWHWILTLHKTKQYKILFTVLLLLIPLHHIMVYPVNLFNLGKPSPYQYSHIFNIAPTPEKSLDLLVKNVQKEDLKLGCQDPEGKLVTCRYTEGYAAVASTCIFNNLNCNKILGYDDKTSQFIPLEIKLWEEYYFEH